MSYPSLKPSDRISRKQIAIFLDPDTHAAIRAKANGYGMPLQEALAEAINMELESIGRERALSAPRVRVFKRINKAAAPREKEPRPARKGRLSICGWYDKKDVKTLSEISMETGRSIQKIGEAGVQKWMSKLI